MAPSNSGYDSPASTHREARMDAQMTCAEHTWVLREVLFDDFGVSRDEECAACGSSRLRAEGHVYD